uniref:Methionine sulfoxide reductase B1b n=1 Tax=Sinocyclocheilus rhinocerous TaxID=307959 RepID=A0A673IYF9_9TELE
NGVAKFANQLCLNITIAKKTKCLFYKLVEKDSYLIYCFSAGIYVCFQCGHPLFSSRSKYEHSSPWPAFTETIREDSVTKHMETLTAYKVLCGKCGNGLGHEFLNDGPEEGLTRF